MVAMAKQRSRLTLGTVGLAGVFLMAYLLTFPNFQGDVSLTLILALAGAAIAIFNIRIKEQQSFLRAITALNVIIISWLIASQMWEASTALQASNVFLANLAVGFGVAGFIVAMAEVIQLGAKK